MVSLTSETISKKEIDRLVEWLKTYPRLTKGEVTLEFERAWADMVGSKYAVFVNSGSSANLLMMYAVKEMYMFRNNKVVIPTLSWATDLAPAIQLGLNPILVDCDLSNLGPCLRDLEMVFREERPSTFLCVSILGLPPFMAEIVSLCKEYNVVLIEDNCESLGSVYSDKMLGRFGLMSSFSLFYSHHISTIEGGMIVTDDEAAYRWLLVLRNHGWSRDLPEQDRIRLRNFWGVSEFSDNFTFYEPGFNLRSTDLQAYIGLGQLERLLDIVRIRNRNYKLYIRKLSGKVWTPNIPEVHYVSNFGMPIITEAKELLVKNLAKEKVECRPLVCGSMGRQPMWVKRYGEVVKTNATIVDHYGIYVPNHEDITESDVNKVCDIILETEKQWLKR